MNKMNNSLTFWNTRLRLINEEILQRSKFPPMPDFENASIRNAFLEELENERNTATEVDFELLFQLARNPSQKDILNAKIEIVQKYLNAIRNMSITLVDNLALDVKLQAFQELQKAKDKYNSI